MAHSYKRTPWSGDNKGPNKKKYASRRVRRQISDWDSLPQGGKYKQLYESWDICDYGSRETWHEYWNRIVRFWHRWGKWNDEPFPNKEEEWWNWYKYCKRK